ncbi:hypothetical protein F2Q68_00025107 [Brassica cretica]|uniref:Uncharacterized protein n=1 Tax=Brassica cretica TaxID=69181 RepID=A0A8S9IC51_BRACR|nr:hypothetical protein F2Q68_00025107 [Brassica cretica]
MGNPCRVGVTRETEPQLEPPGELQGRDEDITIVPARPSAELYQTRAELDWSSSADGQDGRVFDQAQPNPPSLTGSARRMAELVVLSIQLGHPPSWTGSPRRMAELVVCYAPQKVRTNELDCVSGSVIHFSRVFCSGTFVEVWTKPLEPLEVSPPRAGHAPPPGIVSAAYDA